MKKFSILAGMTALFLTCGQAQQHRGMPAEARETIHGLFTAHEKIDREVSITEEGYVATTTSSDPKVAKLLQTHVEQMERRLEQGLMVRRWDPAFEEFVRHYHAMTIRIQPVEGGMQVTVVGKTEGAQKVVRNHAGIISRFVSHGWEEHDRRHPAVLEKSQ